jgi:hypothetical protein
LDTIRKRIVYGDGNGPRIEDELRDLWNSDFLGTTILVKERLGEIDPFIEPLDWASVREHIRPTAEAIEVHLVNGSSADSLRYEEYKERGLKVIAVGGDKLSRGLTLEGLTVSYFLRSSRMYDTLMQMGRWFGYRDRYADLCRLYLPAELAEWFVHITEASEELRRELDHMKNIGGTPRDYGLRVRTHPALLVTSQVKMREGTRLQLSFAGQVSETVVFRRDAPAIRRNLATATSLIETLGAPSRRSSGKAVWDQVPASVVLKFLTGYDTHPAAYRADARLLGRYIEEQQRHGELVDWTVCLASSGAPTARMSSIAGLNVGLIRREDSRGRSVETDRLVIRRILSPADEAIDLSDEERRFARQATAVAAAKDGRTSVDSDRVSGRAIRAVRPARRGLILIYPLDPTKVGGDATIEDKDTPVIGFAVSFPDSRTARAVEHVVNHVYFQQYYPDNDWSEDEDVDS